MMKAPFLGHVYNGVCTHKDMDQACGCVTCTYCDIRMIECVNRAAGLPCTVKVDVQPVSRLLEDLAKCEDLSPSWKTDDELDRLVELEERLLNGDDVVLVYPHGRYVRHTL